MTLDETKLSKESEPNNNYEFYLNFLRNNNNNEDLQNEDLRIFFMFRLIFEKSHILFNSMNSEQTDLYIQKIKKLQSDLTSLNQQYSNLFDNMLQEFNKIKKLYYELLKNIVDNKQKLARVFHKDSENFKLDNLQISDNEYKLNYNRNILSLINKFEETESLIDNKAKNLIDKKLLFQEIKSVFGLSFINLFYK